MIGLLYLLWFVVCAMIIITYLTVSSVIAKIQLYYPSNQLTGEIVATRINGDNNNKLMNTHQWVLCTLLLWAKHALRVHRNWRCHTSNHLVFS